MKALTLFLVSITIILTMAVAALADRSRSSPFVIKKGTAVPLTRVTAIGDADTSYIGDKLVGDFELTGALAVLGAVGVGVTSPSSRFDLNNGSITVRGADAGIRVESLVDCDTIDTDSEGNFVCGNDGGGGGGHTIQDEGVNRTARTNLNFIGDGVTATDNAGADSTDITIAGAIPARTARVIIGTTTTFGADFFGTDRQPFADAIDSLGGVQNGAGSIFVQRGAYFIRGVTVPAGIELILESSASLHSSSESTMLLLRGKLNGGSFNLRVNSVNDGIVISSFGSIINSQLSSIVFNSQTGGPTAFRVEDCDNCSFDNNKVLSKAAIRINPNAGVTYFEITNASDTTIQRSFIDSSIASAEMFLLRSGSNIKIIDNTRINGDGNIVTYSNSSDQNVVQGLIIARNTIFMSLGNQGRILIAPVGGFPALPIGLVIEDNDFVIKSAAAAANGVIALLGSINRPYIHGNKVRCFPGVTQGRFANITAAGTTGAKFMDNVMPCGTAFFGDQLGTNTRFASLGNFFEDTEE